MQNNLKISLVIPAYNEEKYIAECLDFALRHSRDVAHAGGNGFSEIIVIDNASTDKTKEIVEDFARKHPQANVRVVTEHRKGLTRARQRGMDEAKGDVIAYIDADTHMPKGWFELLVAEFSRDRDNKKNGKRELAVLSGPYIYHDTSRREQFLTKIFYWRAIAMPVYWMLGFMVVGGNFAIRRNVLEKMGGFDTTIEFYGEDTNIARRASQHGKVKFKQSFYMYTSARRLKGQGTFKIGLIYMKNFVSEALFKKPATTEYKDIR